MPNRVSVPAVFLRMLFLLLAILGFACVGAPALHATLINNPDAANEVGQYDDSVSSPGPIYTTATVNNAPSYRGMSGPVLGITLDGTDHRLFVSDTANNRVLVYNMDAGNLLLDRIPDNVIGQTNFRTVTAATTQVGLNVPNGLAYDATNKYLFVAQTTGNRVSIFNLASGITNGMGAMNVLGQPDFTTTTAATTQVGMNVPNGIAYDSANKYLFVAQSSGNRVTVYNLSGSFLGSDGMDASDLLGQFDDTVVTPGPIYTKAIGNNTPSYRGLNGSIILGLAVDTTDHRLFVSDYSNFRVLVYNLDANNLLIDRIPDNVIGQANFYTATAATTQSSVYYPNGLAYDSTNKYLFVAQTTSNRVSVFNLAGGITNGMNAMNVIGQADFVTATAASTQAGMNVPYGIAYDSANKYLFVSNYTGNRVTVYNLSSGISNGLMAFRVLGQNNFTAATAASTQAGMNGPVGLTYDPTSKYLFVANSGAHRVTVYDLSAGSRDGQEAKYVLGQTTFTGAGGGNTQAGMNGPYDVTYDGTRKYLFVANYSNNRVTVYDLSAGITDGQNAAYVLGQGIFTTTTAYNSQAGMNNPSAVLYDDTSKRLYVSHYTANRVTIYNLTSGILNGQDASDVLGQYDDTVASPGPLFTKATANDAPNYRGFNLPVLGLTLDGTDHRLFLSDSSNNRVLVYNLDANNLLLDRNPDNVIGQPDFHTSTAATTQAGLNLPYGLTYDSANKYLFVVQWNANRVSVFNLASGITNGMNAMNVLGQPDFVTSTSGTTQAGMTAALGAAYDSARKLLFVSQQTGAHRVTVYGLTGGLLTSFGADATNVLGQYDDTVATPGPLYTKATVNNAPSYRGLSAPTTLAIDSTDHRLFLSDTNNNRVLVYNLDANNLLIDRIPDNVIGQADFHSGTAATTQAGLNLPYGLAYDSANKYLFVAQYTGGNRVTVYNLVSGITNGMNAMNVIGQPDFTTTTAATTQAGMNLPVGLAYDSANKYLFVSQGSGNRVTVYDLSSGIANGMYAKNVLGQANFTATTAATTQVGMNVPYGLLYDSANKYLFVANFSGNRVTVYDLSLGITDGQNAIKVLGQSNFTNTTAATTQVGMNNPYSIAYNSANKYLFVAQSTGNRVTVYDVTAITDGENAIKVLGQSNFTNTSAASTQTGMNVPNGVVYDTTNNYLFVAQATGNRVTVYDLSAGITDGQNAANVLGQYDDTVATPGPIYTTGTTNNAPNILGMSSPILGLALDTTDHRLFVSDTGNNRVLVYNLDGSNLLIDRIPDNIIGQADFRTVAAATTQAGLNVPNGIAYDSARKYLFVAQGTGNRVTVYDLSAGITNGQNAYKVLGQANFTGTTAATTQVGMNVPQGLVYNSANSYLYVAQSTGNRVTVYDLSAGITDGQNAIKVLGQANFTATTAATTQVGMNVPNGLAYDTTNNYLFVSQSTGNRVTVYDLSAGITDGQNAIKVLGQANFTATAAANTQAGMNAPQGVTYDNTKKYLYVVQSGNNRVTAYDLSAGITDGQNAFYVLGQNIFTNATAYTTQAGLSGPKGVLVDTVNLLLYVSDTTNNRIMIFPLTTSGISNGKPAMKVLGQSTFTGTAAATTQVGMNAPSGLTYDSANKYLFVAQQTGNRVTVYDLTTITDGQNAIKVLGQANFTATAAANSQVGMNNPYGVDYDGTYKYLYVAEPSGNRVKVYDLSAGITDGQNAKSVLGQNSFTTATAANTQGGMNSPYGVVYDSVSKRLYVAQYSGYRVSIYNLATQPISNGKPAFKVLGQANFTATAAATTQVGMNVPFDVVYDSARKYLFVSQVTGNRVTVYDLSAGITDGQNALNVLGQSNWTNTAAAVTQVGMSAPRGMAYDSLRNYLYVSQSTGNRVTAYDVAAISDGENAINVLGQSSFTTTAAASTQSGMNVPQGTVYDTVSKRLYVSQSTGNRVTAYDLTAILNGEDAVDALGQYDDTVATPGPLYTKATVNDAPNYRGLSGPVMGLALDGVNHRMFVSDTTNNRVLVYNMDENNALVDRLPDYVLGQADFHTSTAATTQAGLNVPNGITYDSTNSYLFVAQTTGNRVSVFNLASGITNGMNAMNVLGQANFTGTTAATTQVGMNVPTGLTYDATSKYLFVAENTGNRVTVYNLSGGYLASDGADAADVLGQYDDTVATPGPLYTKATTNNAPSYRGLSGPSIGIALDATNHRLFVADVTNNRVLVYNMDSNNLLLDRLPDNVIGQADFHTSTAATTQAGLNVPYGLAYDSANYYLFVAQGTGNRVTVYNLASGITNGMNAMNVLGQIDFTTTTAATTQGGMNVPISLAYDSTNKYLFVSQQTGNRVTVYDLSLGISNGLLAKNVLGQANFTATAAATTQVGMNVPFGLTYDSANKYLFVSQYTGNRVTVYDLSAGITDGQNAIKVLGQSNFTNTAAATTQVGMNAPYGLAYDATNKYLFVSQTTGNRVTVYDLSAGITDGQNAIKVLGQSNFTNTAAATTQTGMNAPSGLAYDTGSKRLYIEDTTNNRVIVQNLTSGISDNQNAADVLGQYDDTVASPGALYTKATANNAPSILGLSSPTLGLALDTTDHRLFVTDRGNNRVLVYNLDSGNTLIDRVPDNVIGQADFRTVSAATTQAGLNTPYGLAYDSANKYLFVAQYNGNRVTVYNLSSGISNGQNAYKVLGQSNWTNTAAATTQAGMNNPIDVTYDSANKYLFVVQQVGNRVTVYDLSAGISDGQNAYKVLGQTNFTNTAAATTQAGMNVPIGITYDSTNKYLFVAQNTGNRVTVYDLSSGITDGQNAYRVLGQADFTSTAAATTQAGMNVPYGMAYDVTNKYLFVAQSTGNRVTVYNLSAGITNGQNAFHVLGQSSFTVTTAGTTQANLSAPSGVLVDSTNKRLYVSDTTNNRIVIYNLVTSGISNGKPAAYVLGQPNFVSTTAATSQVGMNVPFDVTYDSTKRILFVSQGTGNRVTTYDLSNGIQNGMFAKNVIGQQDFFTATAANTQVGLNGPRGITYDLTNKVLYVVQTSANRVSVFDMTSGITDGMDACNVIGQSTFALATAATSQAGMNAPSGILLDRVSKKLYVSQTTSNRVAAYDLSAGVTTANKSWFNNTFNIIGF